MGRVRVWGLSMIGREMAFLSRGDGSSGSFCLYSVVVRVNWKGRSKVLFFLGFSIVVSGRRWNLFCRKEMLLNMSLSFLLSI